MTMPLTYQREIASLQVERDKFKAERDALARDLADAASDFPVPLPEPGSNMAKVITANRLLRGERDDLARQLGDITAVVAACTHFPRRDTIAETILAADGVLGRIDHKAAQARQETLREVARAMGAEEAYEAMEATCGPSGVTPEGLAGAVRIALGLTEPHAKVVSVADPFAGIMDGPEMMPTWDGPSDLGDVKMSAHCEGEGDQ